MEAGQRMKDTKAKELENVGIVVKMTKCVEVEIDQKNMGNKVKQRGPEYVLAQVLPVRKKWRSMKSRICHTEVGAHIACVGEDKRHLIGMGRSMSTTDCRRLLLTMDF